MLLIETRNVESQTVLSNGIIDVGATVRRYCKRATNGQPTFVNNDSSITLNGEGIYEIMANFVFTAEVAGDVVIQALENGMPINGVFVKNTVAAPGTDTKTLTLHYKTLVDSGCVLGIASTFAKSIAFQNTGVPITLTSVIVDAKKLV